MIDGCDGGCCRCSSCDVFVVSMAVMVRLVVRRSTVRGRMPAATGGSPPDALDNEKGSLQ